MKTLPRLVLLGTALCGLVLNTTPTPAASCVSRPAGLVAWWPGNGSTEDIVGTNNGTLHGATYAVGEAGQGFSFTGSGSAVSVTNTTALQLQDFTIEAWIKRASLTKVTMGIYQGAAFFCQSWGGYAFGIWDDGTLQLGKVGTSAVYSHFAVTDTNFHHVAVTKGGSNVVFYIDGVAEMADVPYDPGFVFSGPAAIGARGGDYANGFYGVIDEMSIYTRGLASSEVQSIYAASSAGKCVTSPAPVCVTPPSGLVAWWPGNGTAEDIVGTNNGTLDGVSFAPGKVGSGFNLTATRTGVSVGNPASLQLQDFTIETWIKRSSAETITLDVFSTAGFFTCYWGGYSLGIMSDGRLFLSKVGYSGAIATAAVTDTNFHHVAVSKAGSNVVIYLDGVGEVLAPYDPGFVFNGPSAIGSRGGDYYGSFYGLIDEMSIYNRGLSASEIQAIYNASSAGKCVTPASPANPNPDRLVWINPGTFTMGSPDTEQDRNPEEVNEGPQTQVTLTRGFFMGNMK